MSKIKISTISLSSRNMRDLKEQIDTLLKSDESGERIYEVGPYYEAAPGFMAVDIGIFMEASLVAKYKALNDFENSDEGMVH